MVRIGHLLLVVAIAGCAADPLGATDPDLATSASDDAGAVLDLGVSDLVPPTCLDPNPAPDCRTAKYGHPLPLQSDPQPDPLERDRLIGRDFDGNLRLSFPSASGVAWIPNTYDLLNTGTISKLDAREVREVARYLPITCGSLPAGAAVPATA